MNHEARRHLDRAALLHQPHLAPGGNRALEVVQNHQSVNTDLEVVLQVEEAHVRGIRDPAPDRHRGRRAKRERSKH